MDPEKIASITKSPAPQNATEVRIFLGLAEYYRKFVPDFAITVKPLTQLTGKDVKFEWTEGCAKGFEQLNDN